jgi:hypothetical protein
MQISVTNEVKSRARIDETKLETTKEVREILKISLIQVQHEGDEEKNVQRN